MLIEPAIKFLKIVLSLLEEFGRKKINIVYFDTKSNFSSDFSSENIVQSEIFDKCGKIITRNKKKTSEEC